ncbi:hypothetical protein HOD20_01150 [archaeon]|jgi:hypothetical protein|nr:hypothetical protein [archaeon]MBT4648082.1 hypothetical protein [archaeon]MBT6822520.1 hypothetical protein [archaeon]MBT7392521.1 hypothetical protein [archaeon]
MTFHKTETLEDAKTIGTVIRAIGRGKQELEDRNPIVQKLLEEENYLTLDNIVYNQKKKQQANSCDDTEEYFQAMLSWRGKSPENDDPKNIYRAGVILFYDSKFLGIYKYENENLFLSARNVRDSQGKPVLFRGGIYQMDDKITKSIDKMPIADKYNGKWMILNIPETEKIFVSNLRYIHEGQNMIDSLKLPWKTPINLEKEMMNIGNKAKEILDGKTHRPYEIIQYKDLLAKASVCKL